MSNAIKEDVRVSKVGDFWIASYSSLDITSMGASAEAAVLSVRHAVDSHERVKAQMPRITSSVSISDK